MKDVRRVVIVCVALVQVVLGNVLPWDRICSRKLPCEYAYVQVGFDVESGILQYQLDVSTCILRSRKISFSSQLECSSEESVSLQLQDSTLNCATSGDSCQVSFDLKKNSSLTLEGESTIEFGFVHIEINSLFLDTNSSISASGLGVSNYNNSGSDGGGGGNAGFGSPSCTSQSDNGGFFLTRIENYQVVGGAGSCSDGSMSKLIKGGGLIIIQARDSMQILGRIASDGISPDPSPAEAHACGGSAGGSILLKSPVFVGSGRVSTRGGSGVNGGGGGSGGRIFFYSSNDFSNIRLQTSGGKTSVPKDSPNARCKFDSGASGISIMSSMLPENTYADVLICSSPSTALGNLQFTVLDFRHSRYQMSNLELSNCKILIQDGAHVRVRGQIKLSMSELVSQDQTIRLTSSDLRLASDSFISGEQIYLDVTGSFVQDSSSVVTCVSILSLNSTSVSISNTFGTQDTSRTESTVKIRARDIEIFRSGNVVAQFVGLHAEQSLKITGSIQAKFRDEVCSNPVSSNFNCTPKEMLQPDRFSYGILLFSNSISIAAEGTVTGESILSCSDSLFVLGKLSVSDRGCTQGQGEGAGSSISNGPSGGGGHSGAGGNGIIGALVAAGGQAFEFVHSGVPEYRGSGGGGTATGGSGGGVIHILANGLVQLSGHGSIEANGQDGSDSSPGGGGGGGSGGSVAIRTSNLKGEAGVSITASGGKGGFPGGGGGGGGFISLEWIEIPPTRSSDFAGTIYASGGTAALNGTSGASGILLNSPRCDKGTEGLFCLPCKEGLYNNGSESFLNECEACPAGLFASSSGSSSCDACKAGTIAPLEGSSQCEKCPAGTFSLQGAAVCRLCQPGEFSGEASESCSHCPVNTYSEKHAFECTSCGPGFYAKELGSSSCSRCCNAPTNSHYVEESEHFCSYICEPGFVYPKCITPWQNMIDGFHGPWIFATFVLLSAAIFSMPFFFCWFRSNRLREERYLADLKAIARMGKGARESDASVRVYRRLDSELDEMSLEESVSARNLDLTNHLHRIFLSGNNSTAKNLCLLPVVDDIMSGLVYPDLYSVLADQISTAASWSKVELLVFKVLKLIYNPFVSFFSVEFNINQGIFYMDNCREAHVAKISKFLMTYDYGCLRDPRARSMANSWKFDCSQCGTLAWIDVYRLHDESVGSYPVGKPVLPMALICAGDGSFFSPYQLNLSDPLLKCVASYFGPKWYIFVANLNSFLRAVCPMGMRNKKSVEKALQYVDMMMCVGIGIGKHFPLGGINVSLGFVYPRTGSDIGRLSILISYPELTSPNGRMASPGALGKIQDRLPPSLSDVVSFGNPSPKQDLKDVLCTPGKFELLTTILRDDPRKLLEPTWLIWRFWNMVFFQRHGRTLSPRVWASSLWILLLGELLLNLSIITVFAQIRSDLFWTFISVPPLANLCSPLIGLATIVMSSVVMARIHVSFNVMSLANTLIVLILGALNLRVLSNLLGIVLPLSLLFVKVLIAQASLFYIPHMEFEKDILLSRVDIVLADETHRN